MANHLIIGLGGTGGKVIREFRKRIFEEYRSNTPNDGLYLEYLYLDSSDTDINSTAGWSVLGNDISLGNAQKVSTHGINKKMFDDINAYPGMAAFLKPQDLVLMKTKLGKLINDGIGGQRRRLGRVLLANNLADQCSANDFGNMLRAAVNNLQQKSNQQNVTFHICAGLAGGTGSGSIVDVVSLIRTWYPWNPNQKSYKVRLMLYVPEANLVSTAFNAGFYQANGYAALLELNALSVGAYHPVDITGQKDPLTNQVRRLLCSQEPFEAAYLYTNVNAHDNMLNLNTELPQAVADFLYQSVVLDLNNNQQLSRLVTCENNGATPENDKAGFPARSRRFMTFGITRVEYPENEITEYVTYNFAQQAASQLVYNYWVNGQGYSQRPDNQVGAGFKNEIRSLSTQEKLMLAEPYLKLEKPIVNHPGTDRWKDIASTWNDLTINHLNNIVQTLSKERWVDELDTRCKNYYNSLFRGVNVGVDNFFKVSQESIPTYAQTIRDNIEHVLFDEWATGTGKSVQEIEKYLADLIAFCSERCNDFDAMVGDLDVKLQNDKLCVDNVRQEWCGIPLLGRMLNQHHRVLEKFRAALENYYVDQTNCKAFAFAKLLMTEIVVLLQNVSMSVKQFKQRLSTIAQDVQNQAQASLVQSNTPTLIKLYDAAVVRNFVNQKNHDKSLQEQLAVNIRTALLNRLDEGVHSFSNILRNIADADTSTIILQQCNAAAINAMQQAAINNSANIMVGVNILNKLQNQLPDNKAIAKFVNDVVAKACVYTQWDQAEAANMAAGGGNAMMNLVQLSLPAATQDNQSFRQRLIDAFTNNVSGFDPNCDVTDNPKNNQLVVITCNAGFPARFVSNLSSLRSSYEGLVADNNPNVELNKMVLHTESFDKPLPSLYEISPAEIRKMVEKPLFLAFAMDLIKLHTDSQTGMQQFCLHTQTAGDVFAPPPIKLGSDIKAILDVLSNDFALASKLLNAVENALPHKTQHIDDKKILRDALAKLLQEQILTYLCHGNQLNPSYGYYYGVVTQIVEQYLN